METLNEIMNRNKTSSILPKEFIGNSPGEKITDPKSIANRFNDYFVNIGPGLAKKLSNSTTNFDKYLTNSCKGSFFINPITKDELENEINNLNAKKSPGYDGISSQVIKAIATEISEPLSHIFKVIPQFCIAHFYCAYLITYNFIHYTYRLKQNIIL